MTALDGPRAPLSAWGVTLAQTMSLPQLQWRGIWFRIVWGQMSRPDRPSGSVSVQPCCRFPPEGFVSSGSHRGAQPSDNMRGRNFDRGCRWRTARKEERMRWVVIKFLGRRNRWFAGGVGMCEGAAAHVKGMQDADQSVEREGASVQTINGASTQWERGSCRSSECAVRIHVRVGGG